MLRKILLFICLCIFIFSKNAFAELRSTNINNVTTMESAYTYQATFNKQGKIIPINSSTKDKDIENIFSIYLKSTRLYNKKFTHYRLIQELAITSNTKDIDLLFDSSLPPRLQYQTDNNEWKDISLTDISYCDPYFISFKVNEKSFDNISNIQKLRIVFPYIVSSSTDKSVKKTLKEDSVVNYIEFSLPISLLNEWKTVLKADLSPNKVKNTL